MIEMPIKIEELNAKILKENSIELENKYIPTISKFYGSYLNDSKNLPMICNRDENAESVYISAGGDSYYCSTLRLGRSRTGKESTFSIGLPLSRNTTNKNMFGLNGSTDGSLIWLDNDLAGSAIVAKSLGQNNGYVKYASGLIIQWGLIHPDGLVSYKINFNIPFSNHVLYVGLTPEHIGGAYYINQLSLTSATANLTNGIQWVRWFAIGC